MFNGIPVIPQSAAEATGYHALTNPYNAAEYKFLENTIADMRRGNIEFVLVAENPNQPNDICVYRR